MHKYLLFRLYAPLCSWGDIAVGEVRPTSMYPSKSAVIGLLAAALGISRDEEVKILELSKNYGFAVLVESYGKPLLDYHTAQVPPWNERYNTRREELTFNPKNELKTILSTRHYYCDALYTIILRELNTNEYSMEDIVHALMQPHFTLYLGRKSCPPALSLEPQIIEAETLQDAVRKIVFKIDIKELGWKRTGNNKGNKDLFFEECYRSEITGDVQIYERRDIALSRKRWQFDMRKEYHVVIGG